MIHRKSRHRIVVKKCTKYQQNQCSFKDELCWYIHDDIAMDIEDKMDTIEDDKKVTEHKSNSVFRFVKKDLKPPLKENQQN